ncbi:toll/interleukin-1 receptor domain-containing protein [Telluribacter sp. SYSU D00476]|uniref:toll/interleukin-1 receptor domain-containing protein n=1 Tax=Telluribacter sp. SYSU D00476 TaxID=2811430 RepID=UPI001FF2B36E|nr:toll/interleukin-1 receptor domain-containing protein [Telluribacter sp. SYSU D00476]
MASELIIQLQTQHGTFSCEKFDNFPSPKSAYVAICFTDNTASEQLAIHLKTELIRSIANLNNNFIISQPPCGGLAVRFNGCQALGIPDNLKLLIVVSDGMSSSLAEPTLLSWQHTVLPVLKIGNPYSLPHPFNIPNAVFWKANIDEVIPTIFGLVGISEEDQKIFISYRRSDTSDFAEQLFDRLNHEGFDVFLDRFSINPSVNFQNRLYQELADKAMVLLIESPNYQNSQWVQYEIDFAKKYRLGILAINVDNSPKVLSIDDEFRRNIVLNTSKKMNANLLDTLIIDIKQQHSIALYRMRNYLTTNIIAALQNVGANSNVDGLGFITVTNKKGNHTYKIWATPRPPRIDDYHYSDISKLPGDKIIIGPEFMEEKREMINRWLSQKSVVDFYTEGRILDLCNIVYP